MEIYKTADSGLSEKDIRGALRASLIGRDLSKVLILPPDFTRVHSGAGFITNVYYHLLSERGVSVDIMPATGTHAEMTDEQRVSMFGDIPADRFFTHDHLKDVVKIGEVPSEYINEITEGLMDEPVSVEVNRRLMDKSYDLIISAGQVVPHEVVGMSNHSKNIFVGVGGNEMIGSSHIMGAVYGMERIMGRDHSPVRKLFDYANENFLQGLPMLWVLTVTTSQEGRICTNGLFIGEGRACLTEAVKLAQQKNIDFVDRPIKKCVAYLDPDEFRSTWVGNKAIYRTRMAMADGGELIILAPGVERFGEGDEQDALIRKYGYSGRLGILEAMKDSQNGDLRANAGVAAHLIHGSSDGRFSVTYAVRDLSREEIEGVGYGYASYDEMIKTYDPARLQAGYNEINGEEVFFIPNPALGLWSDRERFDR